MLASKPITFSTMITKEVIQADGSKTKNMMGTHNPRTWRWENSKQVVNKFLIMMIDKDEKLCFCTFCIFTSRRGSSEYVQGFQKRMKLPSRTECRVEL